MIRTICCFYITFSLLGGYLTFCHASVRNPAAQTDDGIVFEGRKWFIEAIVNELESQAKETAKKWKELEPEKDGKKIDELQRKETRFHNLARLCKLVGWKTARKGLLNRYDESTLANIEEKIKKEGLSFSVRTAIKAAARAASKAIGLTLGVIIDVVSPKSIQADPYEILERWKEFAKRDRQWAVKILLEAKWSTDRELKLVAAELVRQAEILNVSLQGVLKIFVGYEQVLCYAAFVVACWMIRRCLRVAKKEAYACGANLLGLDAGRILGRDEIRPHVLRLQDAKSRLRGTTLGKALSNALTLFENGGSLQEVLSNVRDEAEALRARLDADLSLVRYLVWAIPSIGFVGTVRGMGQALKAADLGPTRAAQGEIGFDPLDMMGAVTKNLGVAFYSTLVALLLSIVLMWFFHHVQGVQEKAALQVEESCRKELIQVLRP